MFRKIIFFFLIANVLTGCKYIRYSFKEGNIPQEIKSISVQYIENKASIQVPQLSQQLTDKLKQKYLSETRLDLVPSDGDFEIKGTITSYVVEPLSLQEGQKASQNQLKVSVQIQFVNKKNAKANFDESFTQFAEFPSEKNLTSIEMELINIISEKLTQAIFNKTLSDW